MPNVPELQNIKFSDDKHMEESKIEDDSQSEKKSDQALLFSEEMIQMVDPSFKKDQVGSKANASAGVDNNVQNQNL